MLIVY
ncbi:hypothetical protein LINGRAHAP2_LOCUS17709 [Linum grandiflorum]